MLNLKRKTAGFTLLEMALVLVLAGILSMAVGSRFSAMSLADGNLSSCEKRLSEAVVHARNRALLLRDNSSDLTIRKDGYTYRDSGSERSREWDGAEIVGSVQTLKFNEYGSCKNCSSPIQIVIRAKDKPSETRTLIV